MSDDHRDSKPGEFKPDRVHLVGSIGLGSVNEIFQTVGQRLGRRLKRVPDGEIGGRRHWISWQYPLLRASPFLVPDPSGAVHRMGRYPLLCLADGVKPDEIEFGELGYAREARPSYEDFCAARERGELPRHAKFEVCLPTPMAVIYAFCIERDVIAVYKASLLRRFSCQAFSGAARRRKDGRARTDLSLVGEAAKRLK